MLGFRAVWTGLAAAALSSAALAIAIEPEHPDFRSPKASLADAGRMVESWSNGGLSQTPIASFTGASGLTFKRKPFPPGYGRSGFEFEDEILAAKPAPDPQAKPAEPAAK